MEQTVISGHTIAETSIEAKLVYERLKKAAENEIITYSELSKVAGRNVTGRARYVLQTARGMCERNDRIVFGCVMKIGLRRLKNDEIPDIGVAKMSHIRRTVKRATRTMACADYDSLSPEKRLSHNVLMSMFGVLHEATKPSVSALIARDDIANSHALPIGRVFDILKN